MPLVAVTDVRPQLIHRSGRPHARNPQQDGDAVPGPAGDLGRGHPGVQPQGDGGVPQVVGAAAER